MAALSSLPRPVNSGAGSGAGTHALQRTCRDWSPTTMSVVAARITWGAPVWRWTLGPPNIEV